MRLVILCVCVCVCHSVCLCTRFAPTAQAATPAVTFTSLPCSEAALFSASPFFVYITSLGGDMHSREHLLVIGCVE